ncbi:mechanosensitive ion channel family protein [Ramlibacter sp.]|uniref:mechanosensitive ion channel family protein n=1 Tax=Ramlibacter sp. TaxID=1917967 RepID=UPI003D0DB3AD
MDVLARLLRNLGHAGLQWEIAALAGSLALAWLTAWAAGRRRGAAGEGAAVGEPAHGVQARIQHLVGADSVWFGKATVDGLLFPLLALALVFGARAMLARYQPVPLLAIAIPMLLALAGIRFIARILAVVFPSSGFARSVERVFSWMAWLAAVLWILGLLPVVVDEMEKIQFAAGKAKISLLSLLQGILSAGVVLMVALWVSAALEKRVLRDAVHDLSLRKASANAIRASLLLVGLLLALSTAGVDLTALSVLGGALGVGIGFGLQKLAANYVSGFVILFERSLRIGDSVRVDNFEGLVVDIKTRYTLIRSANGRESIVPNEKLITERIENLSLGDTKVLLSSDVSVGYSSDVDVVRRILVDAAVSVNRVIAEPAPSARLVNFGLHGLDFTLYYWIEDPQNGQVNVKSDVNIALLNGLRAEGIEIPYPQQVVHRAAAPPLTSSTKAATD